MNQAIADWSYLISRFKILTNQKALTQKLSNNQMNKIINAKYRNG